MQASTFPHPNSQRLADMQILEAVRGLEEQGWEYHLEASYIEVYNEALRDLLAEGKGRDAGKITVANAIKHGPAGASLLLKFPNSLQQNADLPARARI